jgi:hypothetical protein
MTIAAFRAFSLHRMRAQVFLVLRMAGAAAAAGADKRRILGRKLTSCGAVGRTGRINWCVADEIGRGRRRAAAVSHKKVSYWGQQQFAFHEAFCDVSHILGGITSYRHSLRDTFAGPEMRVHHVSPDARLHEKRHIFHTKRRSDRHSNQDRMICSPQFYLLGCYIVAFSTPISNLYLFE